MASPIGYKPDDWQKLLIEYGISAESAKIYAETFSKEKLTPDILSMMDREMLKELGVSTMGEVLTILKYAKLQPKQQATVDCYTKAPAVKPPVLHAEMTSQQFRKFKIDWDVFTQMTNMPPAQTSIQLYNCADDAVQNAIINTHPTFFSEDPDRLLEMVEALVTQKSNPMVHRLLFASMSQASEESIQQFVVRPKGAAQDCNFSCICCNYDL